jgi:hypothetical protein
VASNHRFWKCKILTTTQRKYIQLSKNLHCISHIYKKRIKAGFRFITTSAILDETANALFRSLVQTIGNHFFP